MISALPTVTGSTPAAATSTSAANAGGGIGSLTSADFLKLLVAQLQNQDPSAPTKPQDLEAEFSSLTTVSDLGTLNSQVASIQAGAGAAQMAQLSNLIGHQVAYTGNTLTVGSNGSATGAFNLAAAGDANVTITNANNQVVGSLALGALPAGQHNFTWNGGTVGKQYSFAVTAVGTGGANVTATPYSVGAVSSVDLSGSAPALAIQGASGPVPSSQVTSVLGG